MLFLEGSPIDPDSISSKIVPNLWAFLVQLIAFLILVVVVIFLAYKPVKKLLKKRNDFIKENIETSKKNEQLSFEKLNEAENKVNASYKEAKDIIENAKVEANATKEQIVEDAKVAANKEKEKALKELDDEIKAKQEELKNEIVDVALDASKKILSREVSDADNSKIVDDLLKDLKKDD